MPPTHIPSKARLHKACLNNAYSIKSTSPQSMSQQSIFHQKHVTSKHVSTKHMPTKACLNKTCLLESKPHCLVLRKSEPSGKNARLLAFRVAWAKKKDFSFVEEYKKTTAGYKKTRGSEGRFWMPAQIASFYDPMRLSWVLYIGFQQERKGKLWGPLVWWAMINETLSPLLVQVCLTD